MFTGLVEEIGVIRSLRRQGKGFRISVGAKKVLHDLRIDDSVSLNGACQTVVRRDDESFDVEAVEETIQKTTLGSFRTGQRINLERALQVGARLGGHIVQGHVDVRASVQSIAQLSTSWLLTIALPREYMRYVAPVGSICIDGVSLTAARVEENRVTVAVIPHTWANTTLGELRLQSLVNVEFDIIGKYVERLLLSGVAPSHSSAAHDASFSVTPPQSGVITQEWLAAMGFGERENVETSLLR
jgi:riboflavin synthase